MSDKNLDAFEVFGICISHLYSSQRESEQLRAGSGSLLTSYRPARTKAETPPPTLVQATVLDNSCCTFAASLLIVFQLR
jgi:hypothetical protein